MVSSAIGPEGACVRSRFAPSAARPQTLGGFGAQGLRGLGTRRQRFWFAVVGLAALILPYATLMAASVRAMVNPPAARGSIPVLSMPVARFPALGTPKL